MGRAAPPLRQQLPFGPGPWLRSTHDVARIRSSRNCIPLEGVCTVSEFCQHPQLPGFEADSRAAPRSCRTGRAEPSARIDPYVRVTTARWRRREADAIAIQRRQNEINVGYKAASGQKQIAAVKWLLYWQGVIDHVDCVQREGLTPAQVGQLHPPPNCNPPYIDHAAKQCGSQCGPHCETVDGYGRSSYTLNIAAVGPIARGLCHRLSTTGCDPATQRAAPRDSTLWCELAGSLTVQPTHGARATP